VSGRGSILASQGFLNAELAEHLRIKQVIEWNLYCFREIGRARIVFDVLSNKLFKMLLYVVVLEDVCLFPV
jgi:hypothetical protein